MENAKRPPTSTTKIDPLIDELRALFTRALQAIEHGHQAEITPSTQERFGHYQCNSAMKLAKSLGMNPRAIAQQIVTAVGSHPSIENLEIAGPGFINITLSSAYLSSKLTHVLNDPFLGILLLRSPSM